MLRGAISGCVLFYRGELCYVVLRCLLQCYAVLFSAVPCCFAPLYFNVFALLCSVATHCAALVSVVMRRYFFVLCCAV